jgi:import receptor subunit TOM20
LILTFFFFCFVWGQINHSCAPSARISFNKGTYELHLIAARDLEKGDEITMAYVDVAQHPDESPEEARRRRRQELARGWKFACTCEKCLADGPASETGHSTLGITKDESKSEKVLDRAQTSLS